ncbi:LysR substrate-binding domain-containing protein, partial [Acinetobacter baumannii]
LIDGLADFARSNPSLILEFQTDTQVLSLARRHADIALRLGRPTDSGLLGRKLANVHYAFYASPKLAAAISKGATPRLI